MELMKKLFHGKGYIDGITIINLEGEILFTAKLNNKLSSQEEPYELVGQKFLDVYENLDPKTSTTIKAMELGLPVYIENQLLKAQGKEEIRITSLSIPIKSGKQIVGAIDLSMQESAGGIKLFQFSRQQLRKAGQPEHGFLYNSGYHCRRRENEESKGVHKRCGRL